MNPQADRLPLSARVSGTVPSAFDEVTTGVPGWLAPALDGWLRTAADDYSEESLSLADSVALKLRTTFATKGSASIEDAICWIRQTMPERPGSGRPDRASRYLDVLDAALRTIESVDFLMPGQSLEQARAQRPAELEAILVEAGSAWRVVKVEAHWELQARLSDETLSVRSLAVEASDDPDRHLERAWAHAFGRNPDAASGYREAVNAVEHVAVPIVLPKDETATLGKVIGQIRSSADWRLRFRSNPAKPPRSEPIEVFVSNLELLWNSDPRHGNDDRGTPSIDEAKAAVLLATHLVGWFTDGTFHQGESPSPPTV